MLNKIDTEFTKKSFDQITTIYEDASKNMGLWKSEDYLFEKYLKKESSILDIGCGAGRTTFALFNQGFTKIVGVDFSINMINKAENINALNGLNANFLLGDATDLDFPDTSFASVIFSFNGLMMIPGIENRMKALKEIYRVLEKDGVFIFTTHDRDSDENFIGFWEEERERWDKSEQNIRYLDFGDMVMLTEHEKVEYFINIPSQKEVLSMIHEVNFTLVESFFRKDLFVENDDVKSFSSECMFWVVKK